jgi:DNA-directed RNA polymerase specialized sigma24 family protein
MTQPATAATADLTFEEFFETERGRLFGAIYLMTGSVEEAEEIVQDAFLVVWERWDRVRTMERSTGYLYRIAMNRFRSRRRHLACVAPCRSSHPRIRTWPWMYGTRSSARSAGSPRTSEPRSS